jgi:hypothetical protein
MEERSKTVPNILRFFKADREKWDSVIALLAQKAFVTFFYFTDKLLGALPFLHTLESLVITFSAFF